MRIVESANDRLRAVAKADLDDETRSGEEQRLLNVARAFAVLRVESTVRQLRRELGVRPELAALEAGSPVRVQEPPPSTPARPEPPPARAPEPEPEPPSRPKHRRSAEFGWTYAKVESETAGEPEVIDAPAPPAPQIVDLPRSPEPEPPSPLVIDAEPEDVPPPAPAPEPVVVPETESTEERLTRLLRGTARQEPALRWGVGEREDGTAVLVTDLAFGWIPPGIDLPAGVELLPPRRHTGTVTTMLQDCATAVTYAPGERLGAATKSDGDSGPTETPRLLDMPDDLGAQLAAATAGRTGLPRLAHALAAAAANGGGVPEPEVDVLRVHMDTARYQLLADYPDIDNALLLNCILLAATEAIATADPVVANYHLAWFRALSAPPVIGLK